MTSVVGYVAESVYIEKALQWKYMDNSEDSPITLDQVYCIFKSHDACKEMYGSAKPVTVTVAEKPEHKQAVKNHRDLSFGVQM